MKYIIAINIFLLSFNFVQAQESLNLESAILLGLENNFGIKIADRQIEIAKNSDNWTNAGRTPTIDLNLIVPNVVGIANNFNGIIGSNLSQETYSGSISPSVDANWQIYNGNRNKINKTQLEQQVNQQEQFRQVEVQNSIRDIVKNFYLALFQKERIEVLKTVLQLSEDRIAYENIRKEFGGSSTFNLLQLEDAFLSDSTNLINQENDYNTAVHNLLLSMNVDAQPSDYQLVGKLEHSPVLLSEDELFNQLVSQNVNLQNLLLAERLTMLNTDLTKTSQKPTVNLGSSFNPSGNGFLLFGKNPNTNEKYGFNLGYNINWSVNLSANMRIYDGGLRKQNIQNAQIQEEIARLNTQETERALTQQLRIFIDSYNNQLRVLDIVNARLKNAQRNIEIAEERFKSGQISSFDYRQIQVAYINANFLRSSTLFNIISAKTDIEWITGVYQQ